MKLKKQTYNLEYIEKIFRAIPLIFILILSTVSVFITYIILDAKQKRDIDLLVQKELLLSEFNKKETLLNFSNEVKSNVDFELSSINKILKEHTYKIIGSLNNNFNNLNSQKINKLLENYEKRNNVSIVFFKQSNLNIIYGKKRIKFLSKLIFGKTEDINSNLVLKYIYSQGRYNLQEWKNDLTGALRLSFFDTMKIDGEIYFIGTFSKSKNIKLLTKEMIINQINKSSKHNIWLFDLINQVTYNFKNKHLFDTVDVLLGQKENNNKYEILEYFENNKHVKNRFTNTTLYNTRYKFLICLEYDKKNIVNTQIIKTQYHTLFVTISAYIILITVIIIFASLLFSNFTKKILDRYNKELKLKTDSLTHWKNRFELAIIASNDGLWDIDFTKDKIYFSSKWLEISGYDKGEIKKFADWVSLIHKDDKDTVKLIFEKIFAEKQNNFMCEYRLKTKNDGFKWILARGRLFIDKDSKHKRMLMMSMDIDKSKRMKKELLDVELLVEDGKIVIFKLFNDEKLTVKYISNAIKNYGYAKQIFENKEMNFLDLIHKEDISIIKVAMNAAINNDLRDFTFVCRALNAANEIRWISCRTLILKDHSGNIVNFYGYINDITKIKVSEQELKQKVEEELDKNRQKDRILIQQTKLASMGEMLGNIAHQWRQPLNNVSLFLQFIRDNYKSKDTNLQLINKYFDKSFTQINYMSQTIDDFRNFYKPSKQKTQFNLTDAINSTLEIIRAQLKNERIEIVLNIGDINLYSYENELKQAFLNIFNNAQDAIKQKKENNSFNPFIKMETKLEEKALEISIINNGGQIKEQTLSRIFEPYFTTKFETQGTGIGLYMTKSIIETNIKGKIKVQNIQNDSVCFTIILPLTTQEK